MPKKINFQLTEAGLRELVAAIKRDKRPEVRQRAMGLRLLHEGKAPKEVAEFLSVSQPTVYDWHHRWKGQGVEGLANRPKSGRPVKANQNYVEILEQVVDQDPQALGLRSAFGPPNGYGCISKPRPGLNSSQPNFAPY